jgi:hypothetical protein
MTMSQKTSRLTSNRVWFLAAFTAAALAGGSPAKGAAGRGCELGDYVPIVEARVTVLEGPGDIADEQTRWTFMTSLDHAHLIGPLHVKLGDTYFDLERIP